MSIFTCISICTSVQPSIYEKGKFSLSIQPMFTGKGHRLLPTQFGFSVIAGSTINNTVSLNVTNHSIQHTNNLAYYPHLPLQVCVFIHI